MCLHTRMDLHDEEGGVEKRPQWKRDLEVCPSEHPTAMSAGLVYTTSAAGSGHCFLLKGKPPHHYPLKFWVNTKSLSVKKAFSCFLGYLEAVSELCPFVFMHSKEFGSGVVSNCCNAKLEIFGEDIKIIFWRVYDMLCHYVLLYKSWIRNQLNELHYSCKAC